MKRPNTQRALAALKDFQLDTVDYVFHRMYEQAQPATRFLVADEVGLGKTMVARGVIARVIDRLWDEPDKRIDVVYICSNAAIARQNINRLTMPGLPDQRLPGRITLLPREVRKLSKHRVNFISFTPGTSFNLRSSQGTAEERALLFWLLPDSWKANKHGAASVLSGNAKRDRFDGRVSEFNRFYSIDADLQTKYHDKVEAPVEGSWSQPTLRERFLRLADQLGRRGDKLTDNEASERARIVSELRARLAGACIDSLEPDLIILDEFQRFRDLLHGGDSASDLAQQLFTYPDARVLLLSATPYKMFTSPDESSGEDHYADFVQTVAFLQHDKGETGRFREALSNYRKELFRVGQDEGDTLRSTRAEVERHLRNVMVRTERLAVTQDRSGMLTEVPGNDVTLERADVSDFLGIQSVARTLGHPDVMEFWKSAPYLLSFRDEYKLKQDCTDLATANADTSAALAKALGQHPGLLLNRPDVEAYRKTDPANGRLRALAADTLDRDQWRMLWLPPSLPYYQLSGEFAGDAAARATKRLVFSAWHVVPKVVSSLLSYEAERRMLSVAAEGQPGLNTPASRKNRGRLLRFDVSDGRLTGMPVLALLYPCISLAREFDPLRDGGGAHADLAGLRARYAERLTALLASLNSNGHAPDGGEVDPHWYWAAPLLLDQQAYPDANRQWFGQADLAGKWRGAEPDSQDAVDDDAAEGLIPLGWGAHVDAARAMLADASSLGRMPLDLAEVLADMAIAGPGVTALRALARVCGGPARIVEPKVRNQAGGVAECLRVLFNQAEVSALVRQSGEREVYWRRVLEYASRGCLQSVLDEYAHALVEWTGAAGQAWPEVTEEVAGAMRAALTLRTATVTASDISIDAAGTRVQVAAKADKHLSFLTNFAVRFGASGEDKATAVNRDTDLLKAFSSPFWPFVMCSTSVGQEGLDFHLYCHAVMHWNLPSNPVDLEQREGRVHRYKGHAVRRNVALRYGALALATNDGSHDPWTTMFKVASGGRAAKESDLVPYWVFPVEGGARIERHIPALPLSKDSERADALRRSLAVYRMAFGQSRQEDLVKFLITYLTQEQIEAFSAELKINLAPEPVARPAELVRPPEGEDEFDDYDHPRSPVAAGLEQLRDLLEAFATLRPRPTASDTQRFAKLLDAVCLAR